MSGAWIAGTWGRAWERAGGQGFFVAKRELTGLNQQISYEPGLAESPLIVGRICLMISGWRHALAGTGVSVTVSGTGLGGRMLRMGLAWHVS